MSQTSGLLMAEATTTTNPDPNSISGGLALYPDTPAERAPQYTASTAWQALVNANTVCRALVPTGTFHEGRAVPILLNFSPSGGDTTTYTVRVWRYNDSFKRANAANRGWSLPADSSDYAATGDITIPIENPDTTPWYIQLIDLTGTCAIWYDNAVARAI